MQTQIYLSIFALCSTFFFVQVAHATDLSLGHIADAEKWADENKASAKFKLLLKVVGDDCGSRELSQCPAWKKEFCDDIPALDRMVNEEIVYWDGIIPQQLFGCKTPFMQGVSN